MDTVRYVRSTEGGDRAPPSRVSKRTPREAKGAAPGAREARIHRSRSREVENASIIKEVVHPTWLTNGVVVPKHTGGSRLCIDFTDLNKAFPKDPYPLPRIDQIVDPTAGSELLCFLDAFSGYHQIKIDRKSVV